MKNYIVTYDLNKIGQDYDGLIKAIKNYQFAYPLKSAWFIKTNQSATEVSKNLRQYIDENDRLFIGEINYNRDGWLDKQYWNFLN